ncbi:uncharacterized protein VTP21DRAFT_11023 [Calcarisporiella thermophila]|uniref:uncharacterized protein n=1 Tax=Calcarisporiella thermophila TaxID=911321 RepID=UPI00374324C1
MQAMHALKGVRWTFGQPRVLGACASRMQASALIQRRMATTATDHVPPPRPRSFWRTTRRIFYTGFGTGTAYLIYNFYKYRHPPTQMPFDTEKNIPTVVVLGTGWGATSFLKSIDNENFNIIVVSPRNYFLFTPLLPSCTVGTIENRSIMEPIRYITRYKKREVKFFESECTDIDPFNQTIQIEDTSEIKGEISRTTIPYDYLVLAVGAETQTFGIPGVREYSCFLKEINDAQRIRTKVMDCIETAAFAGQPEEEIERLLHMVVVGGGPTGVEYAAELHDFLKEDLSKWYPEIANKLKITLIEALPNVLPAFSKQLIEYTESRFKEQNIEILTKHMVKEVRDKEVVVQDPNKELKSINYGLLVWAAGNVARPVVKNLIAKFPATQKERRGVMVDDYLRMVGAENIYALGDCTASKYAPTAQVASQQGLYLAYVFNMMAKKQQLEQRLQEIEAMPEGEEKEQKRKALKRVKRIRPFHYSHQGSLAYIGSDKAIADLRFGNGNLASGGTATYLFWRSAYLSMVFSARNRALVLFDWAVKRQFFGRDISRA